MDPKQHWSAKAHMFSKDIFFNMLNLHVDLVILGKLFELFLGDLEAFYKAQWSHLWDGL